MGGLIALGLASLPRPEGQPSPIRRLVLNDVGPSIAYDALQRIGGYLGKAPGFASVEQGAAYLRGISEGPFYIVRGKLNTLTSLNGVKVNAGLQVLDKNDHVIPGLYAIGHDAGGVYGEAYDLKIGEGTASAFAINSGRMAVKTILGNK
jgi:predicted oxidoreductase